MASDFDHIEATAAKLRAMRPILVHDSDAEVDVSPPPEWINSIPAQGLTDPPAPEAVPLLSLAELKEKAAGVKWVVKHVIPADSIGVVFGGSGAFKSFVSLDMALHVAHGLNWLTKKTVGGPVVYIAAEGGSGLWRRIDAWHRLHGLDWAKAAFFVVPVAVDLSDGAARVVEAVRALGITPSLVVVDTMSQTFGGEENSANEVAAYLRELGLWFRSGWACAVVVIHHSGHMATERPRGSSAIRSNVDFMLGVFREESQMICTMTAVKQKDGELLADQTFALSSHDLDVDEDGEPVTSLVASVVLSDEEKRRLIERELRAGRSGKHELIVTLAQSGMLEKDLRKSFYEDCGLDDVDSRRQAYHRALKWAKSAGFLEVVEGFVVVSKGAKA